MCRAARRWQSRGFQAKPNTPSKCTNSECMIDWSSRKIGGGTQKNSRMQSAVAKAGVNGRQANRKREARAGDVGEQILAELAARRVRLQELLHLVRMEVAREVAADPAAARRLCRTTAPLR